MKPSKIDHSFSIGEKKAKKSRNAAHDKLYCLNEKSVCLRFDALGDNSDYRKCLDDDTYFCAYFMAALQDRLKSYENRELINHAEKLQATVTAYKEHDSQA